jgi:hypothetical protein
MCLDTITSGPEREAEGGGYKVFSLGSSGNLCGLLFRKYDSCREGEWISDPCQKRLRAGTYETGFHIFENESDAYQYRQNYHRLHLTHEQGTVVRKVRYRNVCTRGSVVCARGNQSYETALKPCVVAREMFIEPEEKQQCACSK